MRQTNRNPWRRRERSCRDCHATGRLNKRKADNGHTDYLCDPCRSKRIAADNYKRAITHKETHHA